MRYARRITTVIAVVMVASVATIGLAGTAGAKNPTGAPLKFGYIEPFPGESAQPTIVEAIKAYFADWNKRGGYNNQPVALQVESPASFSPAAYIAAVNKLADDTKVVAFLDSGVCMYSVTALRSKHIPTLGATDQCGATDSSFFFATGGRATTLPMLTYAIAQGSKAFGVAYPSSVPGLKDGFVTPLQDYLDLNPSIKTKLVDVPMPFPASAADWDAAIQKMKDAGVDAAFIAVQPDGGVLGLQEARLQGFGPDDGIKWIFGPNFYDPEIAANSAFEGAYALSIAYPWEDTKNPQVKKMSKTIKKSLSKQDGFAESGYQIAASVEGALKGVKSPVTSAALLQKWSTLHKQPYPLTPTKLDWTNVTKNPSVGEIVLAKDGKWVPASDFLVIPAKKFTKKS
jgi:ABC-type branched-subunit amino acid transport system substrate-binding protein